MEGRMQDAMACSEFEALLSEGLDGTLAAPARARFEAHRESCAVCRLMFAETHAGKDWLAGLDEVEAPPHLLRKILAATTGADEELAKAAEPGWLEQLRGWSKPWLQPVLQPRFAMSFAMAFFSVTLVLNVAGVRLSDIRVNDLRPQALFNSTISTLAETQGRVVKYYENLRFVYEIESRVRQLKNATEQNTQPEGGDQKKQQNHNDNTSGPPDRPRQQEQYSLTFEQGILAMTAAPWYDNGVLAVLDRRQP